MVLELYNAHETSPTPSLKQQENPQVFKLFPLALVANQIVTSKESENPGLSHSVRVCVCNNVSGTFFQSFQIKIYAIFASPSSWRDAGRFAQDTSEWCAQGISELEPLCHRRLFTFPIFTVSVCVCERASAENRARKVRVGWPEGVDRTIPGVSRLVGNMIRSNLIS